MKSRILLVGTGLLLILLFFPRPEIAAPVVETRLAVGTVVSVKLYMEEAKARPLMDLAFAEIDRIDSLMSRHSPASELSRVNRLAAAQAVSCSPELIAVLKRSQRFARASGGAFDITVGSLTQLWNFPDVLAPPATARIDSARALVGHEFLQVGEDQVQLRRRGTRLDLGGAAKGFAVDRAAIVLQAAGASSGLIIAGGNIRFWGQKPDGRPWRFGVQHPRAPDQLVEVENLGLNALATSGDYEQFFEYEGERFHHLLDPATGYPSRSSVSATVWAETAMDADILSTAVFVLGPEPGLEWIESTPRTEALVFFEQNGRLDFRASSGVADHLRLKEKAETDFF